MTRKPVQLTVEAMAGSRTQEAAVNRSVLVCSRKPWTGGSEEDMVNKEGQKGEKRGRSAGGYLGSALCRDRRGLALGQGTIIQLGNSKTRREGKVKEFGNTHSTAQHSTEVNCRDEIGDKASNKRAVRVGSGREDRGACSFGMDPMST